MISPTAISDHDDPRRWRMLTLLSVAELFGMSLWFAGSAVANQLGARWNLDSATIAWLTTVVQLGFVCGTAVAAILNLADVFPSRVYFAVCALFASAANASLMAAGSFEAALAARFFTGFFLAGVYPPAMKMAATWFRARRGIAIGTVVGALTVGKATPYLVHAIPSAGPATVVFTASAIAVIAAFLVGVLYHDGPFPFAPRPFSWGLVSSVFAVRDWRLATGGYLGHMFELYSFWTWIPAFILASISAANPGATHTSEASLLAFVTIAIGGISCVWGGIWADRHGREKLVMLAMAVSGSCALVMPAVFGTSTLLLGIVVLTWGFFVIADSAQFSALVTESVPPHSVGTALTIQTSLGFLLTMVSIQLIPPLVGLVGWRWAFPILALGPAAGIGAIRRLLTVKQDAAAPTAAA